MPSENIVDLADFMDLSSLPEDNKDHVRFTVAYLMEQANRMQSMADTLMKLFGIEEVTAQDRERVKTEFDPGVSFTPARGMSNLSHPKEVSSKLVQTMESLEPTVEQEVDSDGFWNRNPTIHTHVTREKDGVHETARWEDVRPRKPRLAGALEMTKAMARVETDDRYDTVMQAVSSNASRNDFVTWVRESRDEDKPIKREVGDPNWDSDLVGGELKNIFFVDLDVKATSYLQQSLKETEAMYTERGPVIHEGVMFYEGVHLHTSWDGNTPQKESRLIRGTYPISKMEEALHEVNTKLYGDLEMRRALFGEEKVAQDADYGFMDCFVMEKADHGDRLITIGRGKLSDFMS